MRAERVQCARPPPASAAARSSCRRNPAASPAARRRAAAAAGPGGCRGRPRRRARARPASRAPAGSRARRAGARELSISSGAWSASNAGTPTSSNARVPAQPRSALPALTSRIRLASPSAFASGRQWFLNAILSVPPLRSRPPSANGSSSAESPLAFASVSTIGFDARSPPALSPPLLPQPPRASAASGRREDCTGWGGTHPWPPWLGVSRRYVWASRRTSGPTRHFARAGPRVFPDAPRVEGVRGCACEATPPGRAHRRSRARVTALAVVPWHAGVVAGRRVGRRQPCVRRGRLGARGLWGRGVGTAAGERVRSRCWRRPAAPGSSPSSTTPAPAPRSLFTVGLLGYAACPAIVAHAALAYPEGQAAGPARARRTRARLRRHAARPRLAARPDLRPRRAGLRRTARQPARRHERARRRRGGHARRPRPRPRVGARARAAGALRGRPLLAPPPGGSRAPVLLPAAAYLVLVAADYAHGVPRGFLSNDGVDQRPVARASGRARAARARGRVGVAARAAGAHRVSRGS